MLGFSDPLFLVLLLAPLLARFLPAQSAAVGAALRVPDGIGERLFGTSASGGVARRDGIVSLALWACLILALAGPRLLVPNPALPSSSRHMIVALDMSGSMVRKDFLLDGQEIARLDALKHVATEFVLRRGGDRVGLVLFGSRAYVASPLTHDVRAVAAAIDAAEIGVSGRATGISDALGLGLKRLDDVSGGDRVMILLSDGVHNHGPVKPRDAARLAREMGVRVHTIAMGPRDLSNADGERDAVDAETLSAIAELSGGTYFRAKTTADLLAVTEAIDRLEPISADGPSTLTYRQLWIWPAGLAVLLLLVSPWLPLLQRRTA